MDTYAPRPKSSTWIFSLIFGYLVQRASCLCVTKTPTNINEYKWLETGNSYGAVPTQLPESDSSWYLGV